jgi:hypothetical protein
MASLLSSLVRGTSPVRRPEDETVTPGGVAPAQPPVSIPPTAQPVPQAAPPSRDLASEPLIPSMDVGPAMFDPSKLDFGALFQNALLKSQPSAPTTTVDTAQGPRVLAGSTPAQDITQIKRSDFKIEDISADAKGLGKFLTDSGGGTYKSGLGLIDDMQTWFNKTTRTGMGETPMSPLTAGTTRDELSGDSPLRKLVGYAASLKNSDAPYAKEQAKAYSDAILWLTKSIENNDQRAYTAAKANIDSLTKLNTEDFARSGTRSQFARNGQLVSAYVTGKTIQQAEIDKEAASTPAIQRKVVTSAVFDYVQDRFKDLRTQAESGGEDARRAQRTLDVFGQSFKDIYAPVTEGTRDARLAAFESSPQGRALITDAFDNLSGLGYFNRPKFKSIVDRSKAGDINLTPADIKSIIGETQYKKRLGSTIDVADDLPDDAIQALKLTPDDPQRISGVYRGLTPQGIGALQGFGDTDQPLGEPLRAGQPDAREFDISQNVRSTDTSTGMTITPVTDSKIKTRGELAGAMVSGLGLNTEQAGEIAKRVFTDTTDQQSFINAATVSYDIQDDVLTKIASDAGTIRVANTGGQTTGGRAKSTYALVSDVFAAANDVLPQQTFTESSLTRRQWDLRKRVLNDAASQAQQIEGSGADDAVNVKRFYTSADGKPDFTKPIVPDAKDQVGRIALLKAMIDKAAAPDGAAYRRQLELLARSAVDGQPYTGSINMNPRAFQGLVSLYASRVESAADADKSGKTDSWFQSKFDIKPSELSKVDNRDAFMMKLVTASPSALRTFASSLGAADATVTRGLIPTTTAGQVIDTAAGIPGDIQGGGRKNSKTENQALGNIDRATKIVGGGFESALDAVLKYNDDPSTVDVPHTKKQYGEALLAVFDKTLNESMKGVSFKAGDKAKFNSLREAIRTEIIKQADTEWTAGTVTKDDLNAILKPLASQILGVDAQKTKALPAVDKPEPSVVKDLEAGKSAYDKAKAELGGDLGTKTDIAAELTSDESSKYPAYQAFLGKLKERRLVNYGRITKEVETRQLGITTAGAKLNRLKQEGKINTPEFNTALDAYNKAHDDYNAKRSELDTAFDLVSQPISLDDMDKLINTKELAVIGSASRSEAFTKLREKISNGGWASLTPTERASYYRESLTRYFTSERGNAISPVTRRRLAFRSFIDSPQGANWAPVKLTSEPGANIEKLKEDAYTPSYLTEVTNEKGDVIAHKLNPNISFKYVPKLNKETNRIDSLDIVAEERITGGDNRRTVTKRQFVVTGREVEIMMALNDMKDIKDEFAAIEANVLKLDSVKQKVTDTKQAAKFGLVQDKDSGYKYRDGGSFSQLLQSLVEFENAPSLTKNQETVRAALLAEGEKYLTQIGSKDSINKVVNKYAKRAGAATRMIKFQDVLRERLADRIDAFSKNGRTPNLADLQQDINDYFDGGKIDEVDNDARRTEMAALQKTDVAGILRADKYVEKTFGTNGPLQISAAQNTKGNRAITMPVAKAYDELLQLRNKIDGGDQSPETEFKFLQLRDKFVEHTGKSISDLDRAFTISNVESANNLVTTGGNKQRASGENFGIRFGEYAQRYIPIKTPRPGFETEADFKKFNKKMTVNEKKRVDAEKELGKTLGFDTTNYSTRSSVWTDLNTKWKNSTPNQWDSWISGVPEEVRNRVLEHYTRWSTMGGEGKNDALGNQGQAGWRAIDWAVDGNGNVTPDAKKVLSSITQWASVSRVKFDSNDLKDLSTDILRMYTLENSNTKVTREDLAKFKSPLVRGVLRQRINPGPGITIGDPFTQFINAIDPTPLQGAAQIVAQKQKTALALPQARRVVNQKLKTDADFRSAVNSVLRAEGERYVITDQGKIAKRSYSAKDPVEPKGLSGDDLFKWRVENKQLTYLDYLRYSADVHDTATQPRDFLIDGKTVTVPVRDVKNGPEGMLKFLQKRMSRAEPKSVTNFEAPKSVVALPPNVDPLRPGRQIGFRYQGADYFIGAKEYASLVQDINDGKISTKDVRGLVTSLVSKLRYRTYGADLKKPLLLGVKAVGEGEADVKKIPKEVQEKMIEEAKKEGFNIKKSIKGGIPGFFSAMIAAIIAEWNSKEE